MDEWISVNERLPETSNTYNGSHDDIGYSNKVIIAISKRNEQSALVSVGVYIKYDEYGHNRWEELGNPWEKITVTHWMPLPELPKEIQKWKN